MTMNILVVDGYNMIGAWDELVGIKKHDIGQARDRLIELLSEYQVYSGLKVIIVFDAYYVDGPKSEQKEYELDIVYTKENETADEYIEKLVSTLINVKNNVYVATSDYTEQRMIFGRGALRKSARELWNEITEMDGEIDQEIKQYNKTKPKTKIELNKDIQELFEKWRRGNV